MQVNSLIDEETIRARISELGRDVRNSCPSGEITVICVLTGSLLFTADLIRSLEHLSVHVEFVRAKSYVGISSGELHLDLSLLDQTKVTGCHVLILDEILDSGKTLHRVVRALSEWNPSRLETAVLLRKEGCQLSDYPLEPDYVGFEVENKFLVGYGLDYNGLWRHLPFIGEMIPGDSESVGTNFESERDGVASEMSRKNSSVS